MIMHNFSGVGHCKIEKDAIQTKIAGYYRLHLNKN